ncbi:MAG TPA: hypothetical protein VND98_10890 [Solirubrobacterales bacterium]|nr:hypothetical protein [Solirubrobacterales bacterium]
MRVHLREDRSKRERPPSCLEPYRDYLVARFADDHHVLATVLHRELADLGHRAGKTRWTLGERCAVAVDHGARRAPPRADRFGHCWCLPVRECWGRAPVAAQLLIPPPRSGSATSP